MFSFKKDIIYIKFYQFYLITRGRELTKFIVYSIRNNIL